MIHHYEMHYENVYLRPLAEEDINSLRKWRNNPQNVLYLSKIPYITVQMQKEWYTRYLENNDEICFAIVENCELRRLVGSLSLYEFNGDTCFFGKILIGDEEAHGRKIGFNATVAVCKIAFEQLGIKEIRLHVFSDNTIALKIYERAGFIRIDSHYSQSGKNEYTMVKWKEE